VHVTSFDIVVLNARGIIGRNINEYARREWLNYVMKFYLSNLRAAISAIARFATCLSGLMEQNLV
jgi:hypothetical protein